MIKPNSFDAQHGLIIVAARIWGPTGDAGATLALDTGATTSVVDTKLLALIGYDPAAIPQRVRMTTGSGIEFAPKFPVERIQALGQGRSQFPILAHTLPPNVSVDGLLGLDFLRALRLTIDFRKGQITLR